MSNEPMMLEGEIVLIVSFHKIEMFHHLLNEYFNL